MNQQMRLAWQGIRIRMKGQSLTLQEWLEYKREFILAINRVDDRTPSEEFKEMMKGLPSY